VEYAEPERQWSGRKAGTYPLHSGFLPSASWMFPQLPRGIPYALFPTWKITAGMFASWCNIHACVDCSLGVQPETARVIRKTPVVSAAYEKGQTNGGRRAFASPASTTNVPSNRNIVTPPQCHHPICRAGREADGRMPFARFSGTSNWVRVQVGRMEAFHLPPHQGARDFVPSTARTPQRERRKLVGRVSLRGTWTQG
jgi:hypothetical protein